MGGDDHVFHEPVPEAVRVFATLTPALPGSPCTDADQERPGANQTLQATRQRLIEEGLSPMGTPAAAALSPRAAVGAVAIKIAGPSTP